MTIKPDDWMPLDVRKYLGDTMHLGREQHGGYLLLIMAYWMRGGPLVDSDQELAAIVRASLPDWKRLRPSMEAFFEVRDGKWVHRKIEKELDRARVLIAKKSKSGKAGANARWGTDGERNADANGERIAGALPVPMANECREVWQTDAPLPLPTTSKKKDLSAKADDPAFLDFWKAYPTDRNMSRKAALAQWHKLPPDKRSAAIAALPGFKAYCSANSWYRPVHAERFLSQERFEGYAGAGVEPSFEPASDIGWENRLLVWRDNLGWHPKWGPPPNEPGCKCPSNILSKVAA